MLALKKKGFTLIEVVIVLAIAALILVIVFLAVGGAQRSQRDQASQEAAGQVVAAFSNYLSDNQGTSSLSAGAALPSGYISSSIKSGRGVTPTNGTTVASGTGFVYSVGYICNGAAITTTGAGPNNIAVTYVSEQSGLVVCRSNK